MEISQYSKAVVGSYATNST